MFGTQWNGVLTRRALVTGLTLGALSACTVVPKTTAPTPVPTPTPAETGVIQSDNDRHRVALLVPLSGASGAAGQSIANAANMALLDTNAKNLRISTYDTSGGAKEAARRAIADGNRLILGPLLSSDIGAVAGIARTAKVPMISFSNDDSAAAKDVFIMGTPAGQSVSRTVEYAVGRGVTSFAALVPRGEYGDRTSDALLAAARAKGASVVAQEPFDRTTASVTTAAQRLRAKSGYEAVLIADGGALSARAAGQLKPPGSAAGSPRLLGTELWSGEKELTVTPALNGAWFAAVPDARFGQFSRSYRGRFGAQPFRIATLGYDAVLLTLRIVRDWKVGTPFPLERMTDSGGFVGLDGAFRFTRGGVVERALEVREVSGGAIKVLSPAPASFGK